MWKKKNRLLAISELNQKKKKKGLAYARLLKRKKRKKRKKKEKKKNVVWKLVCQSKHINKNFTSF